MATYRYVFLDVFTERALAGNQLAVFTDARGLDTETMQALAAEIGFAETTFVFPPEAGGTVRVRIFTPRVELPFAGHPTLGTAWVLAAPLQRAVVELETLAGIVPVTLDRDQSGAVTFGRMQQPVPTSAPYPEPAELLGALGVEASRLPVERYLIGPDPVFVVLDSREAVAALAPDMGALHELGVNAACVAGGGSAWKARVFLPSIGIPEDPATGSAAGPLVCHLCRHGLVEWGAEIEISQGVEIGRPSTIYARAEGSLTGIERVEVGGRAVVVARGEFRI